MPILVAPILGPVIAGAILQFASWRWLFLVNLPVDALGLVSAVLFLPNDRKDEAARSRSGWFGSAVPWSNALSLWIGSHKRPHRPCGSCCFRFFSSLPFKWAIEKKEKALIDLRLFKGKVFSASVTTQFMSHGISFAGQMLIPIFLIRAVGRSPSATGLLLAPLGLGMMCGYPFMGMLTKRFGIRKVSAGGASLRSQEPCPLFTWLATGLSSPYSRAPCSSGVWT